MRADELIRRYGFPPQEGGRHRKRNPRDTATRVLPAVSVASVYSDVDDAEDEPRWANPTHPHHRKPSRAQLFWGSVLIAATITLSMFQAALPVVA